jgi:hypothetical protein
MVGDLFVRFRSPYLLIPVLLLVVTFVMIAVSASILGYVLGAIFILFVIAVLFVAGSDIDLYDTFIVPEKDEEERRKKIDKKRRKDRIYRINIRWEELYHIIAKKLEGALYIDCYAFRELFYVWGLDEESIWYAFAKFAAEHPGKIHFGDIRHKKASSIVKNVLIQIEHLDHNEYEYW